MKEFLRIIIIFFLVCGIVFFSYNIYSFMNGKEDNILSIAMSKGINALSGSGTLIGNNTKLEDSGIKGNEYDFNSVYNPYYSLLDNNSKKLYKQIYANAKEYKETFVPVVEVNIDNLLVIIESILNDHPELFWLGNSFSYKYNNHNIVKQITISFNGTQNDKDSFYKIADQIIKEARTYSTDYEKELFVHDKLIRMISYDSNAVNNQSAYSALVTGKTVCAGYARAFQYIMMQLGIPTYYVTGTADGEEHAWNIVKLNDGYYNVDVTWDDELHGTHTLFNKTDAEFEESHTRSDLSSKLVECNATNYEFKRMSNAVEEEFIYYFG